MTVLYTGNFDAETLNAAPAGWARAGGNFSVTTINPISGTQGVRETAAAALTALIYSTGNAITDGKMAAFYKVTKATGTASISLICRANAGFTSGYFWNIDENGNGQLFRRTSSGYAVVGGVIGNSFGVTNEVGDTIALELSFVGTTIELRRWNVTKGQTRPATAVYTRTDSTHASGFCGILNNTSGTVAADNPTADDITIEDTNTATVATAYTLSGPSTALVGSASGNIAANLNGTLTQAVTITLSDNGGGGTFNPAAIVIAAGAQSGTATYTPASTGAKSISSTNDRSLTNPAAITITANTGPNVVGRNNAAIYYSPGNWCDDGTSHITPNTGAYLKTVLNGTSLVMLTTALAALSNFPRMIAVVDGIAYPFSLSTATRYPIVSGLAAGAHNVEIHMEASDYRAASGAGWWNGENAWKITGLEVEAGATLLTPTIRPYVYYAFGDSLTQGYFVNGTSTPVDDSARSTYVPAIAEMLNAEYGQIGFGGQNWNQAAVGGPPGFNTSYASVISGYSRLTSGTFTQQPDYASTCFGTNGGEAQSFVATGLNNLRAAAPSAFIFPIVPGGGFMRSQTVNAVNAKGDAKIVTIDAGTRYQLGLGNAGPANDASADGTHYKSRTYTRLATEWGQQMKRAISSLYTLRVS